MGHTGTELRIRLGPGSDALISPYRDVWSYAPSPLHLEQSLSRRRSRPSITWPFEGEERGRTRTKIDSMTVSFGSSVDSTRNEAAAYCS